MHGGADDSLSLVSGESAVKGGAFKYLMCYIT